MPFLFPIRPMYAALRLISSRYGRDLASRRLVFPDRLGASPAFWVFFPPQARFPLKRLGAVSAFWVFCPLQARFLPFLPNTPNIRCDAANFRPIRPVFCPPQARFPPIAQAQRWIFGYVARRRRVFSQTLRRSAGYLLAAGALWPFFAQYAQYTLRCG